MRLKGRVAYTASEPIARAPSLSGETRSEPTPENPDMVSASSLPTGSPPAASAPDRRGRRVQAVVNYLGPMDTRPVFYAQNYAANHLNLVPTVVEVEDFRGHEASTSLEVEGFRLMQHVSEVNDFRDSAKVNAVYVPEVAALIGELTGASKVLVNGPVLRWGERAPHPEHINSRPGRFAHVDYSLDGFHAFARNHLAGDPEADHWLAGRYAAFNLWRVLTPPPQDIPLGVVDARTAHRNQVTEGDAVIDIPGRPEFRFGSSLFHADPAHRWAYFSDMDRDEVLVFKAFDSDLSKVQGCPHSAFDDPTCPAGAIPRSSIEIRAFAFWGN